ncbi:MAG: hypothetical protein ACJ72E_15120 [Marmoricola sp.]
MTARALGLPVAAVLAVAATLAVQLGHGGGSFSPLRSADPCAARPVATSTSSIDGLVEHLVLLGLDGAACRLHVSREALTLELAPGSPSDQQVNALHAGLRDAVRRMKADGDLPPASDLVNEVLDTTAMNGLLRAALKALPDPAINSALKTDDVLTRTVDNLDLRTVLSNLDDQATLENQVERAVVDAAKDSVLERLKSLVP